MIISLITVNIGFSVKDQFSMSILGKHASSLFIDLMIAPAQAIRIGEHGLEFWSHI